ncbi:MAG: fibronectin type III domain-containing protein [Syntrophaceae bacterium]|nr:fibronectin type III domain-containing protein [Syntrophaceae bacterium]
MKRCFAFMSKYGLGFFVFIILFALIAGIESIALVWPGVAEAQDSLKGVTYRDNLLIQEAIEVHQRNKESLKNIPDVVGSGVGIGLDGQPVIKVFTKRAGVSGIPERLGFTPVHVEEIGMVIALECPAGWCDRPVPIGVSTGHPAITAGTIAARVRDAAGNVFALSNNHVFANNNNATMGDSALQPGPFDIIDHPYDPETYKIGELYDFQPINFSIFGSNTIDAAIVSTTSDKLGYGTLSEGYGSPHSIIFGDSDGDGYFDNKNDLLQQPIKKFGRTSGLTHGQISEISVSVAVCYANCSSLFFSQLAWFDDQIGIIGNDDNPFSQGGDSGSLIVSEDGNHPVGLLFAGSATKTFANRIDLVLNRFGVTVDDGVIRTPPAAPTNLTATGVSSNQINLTWNDHSNNENGFKIERCQGSKCTNFAQIIKVTANVSNYNDTGLRRNTVYRYRVRAYGEGGYSIYSNIVNAKTSR